MSTVATVSVEKQEKLKRDMLALGILESDITENFIRGRGAGGQKINKTSVAVQLKHEPTGLEVKCQESRSQALNRFLARRLLVDKIREKLLGEVSERKQEREKIRRQKRKRSKRAQQKRLDAKKQHSEKKAGRSGRGWE